MLILITQPNQSIAGGKSMPIGFVDSEENNDEDEWIINLIQHILSCLDEDCVRCKHAVENNFLGILKAS